MTLRAILGVLPPEARVTSGQIVLDGVDLVPLSNSDMNRIRGPKMSMIFQEPMSALNPVMRVGNQIAEGPRVHLGFSKATGGRAGARADASGRHPRPRAAVPRLPARVLRRHAAAGDDRDRAVLRPGDHPVRRADHRARRDDPGPDPAAARAAVPGVGRQPDLRHPRPAGRRPAMPAGRGHVRRSAGRDRRRPRRAARSPAPVHARAGQVRARRRARARVAGADPRVAAEPGQSPPSGCRFHPRCTFAEEDCTVLPTPLRELPGGRSTACLHYERTEEALAADRAGS